MNFFNFLFFWTLRPRLLVSNYGIYTTCAKSMPMITNESTKNEESFENTGFNGKTVSRVQTKKKHF